MVARSLAFAPPPADSDSNPDQDTPQPSYSLLTLTPALLKLLESAKPGAPPFEIRGHAMDAAVLVTPTETFSLRGVQNSNSLCLCQTAAEGKADWYRQGQIRSGGGVGGGACMGEMLIESVLHETLEVLPAAAKTERLEGLLRGSDYTGETNEKTPLKDKVTNLDIVPQSSGLDHADMPTRPTSQLITPRHTLSTLRSLLPASDLAITQSLKINRIVSLPPSASSSEVHLRPLPPSYLLELLPPLLGSIAPADEDDDADRPRTPPAKRAKGKEKAKEEAPEAVRVVVTEQELLDTLDAQDCGEEVGKQVLGWFGAEEGEVAGRWRVEVDQVVREVGVCLLARGGVRGSIQAILVRMWAD